MPRRRAGRGSVRIRAVIRPHGHQLTTLLVRFGEYCDRGEPDVGGSQPAGVFARRRGMVPVQSTDTEDVGDGGPCVLGARGWSRSKRISHRPRERLKPRPDRLGLLRQFLCKHNLTPITPRFRQAIALVNCGHADSGIRFTPKGLPFRVISPAVANSKRACFIGWLASPAVKGRRTQLWREIAALCTAAAALVSTILLGYVYPPSDPAEDFDVVFVLGLATLERLAAAREISAAHGEIPIYVSEPRSREWVCTQQDLTCVTPDPATTKGEAQLLSELVMAEGFEHPVVLTFGPQLVRARYIFDRCYRGDAAVVRVDEPLSAAILARQIGYQSLGMLKAITTPCAEPAELGLERASPLALRGN